MDGFVAPGLSAARDLKLSQGDAFDAVARALGQHQIGARACR
jgi:hypothetical protein